MNDFKFIPFDFEKSDMEGYIIFLNEAQILRKRRKKLGLSQYEVAEMAGIHYTQYQRLEAGTRQLANCSMEVGLSICCVLMLDPFEMIPIDIQQPLESRNTNRKRPGRKEKELQKMNVYMNSGLRSIIIPYEVLAQIGHPDYIKFAWIKKTKSLFIMPADKDDADSYDVPAQSRKDSRFSLHGEPGLMEIIKVMGWKDITQKIEVEPVINTDNNQIVIRLNLEKAVPTQRCTGLFQAPASYGYEDDDDVWDEDESDDEDIEE